MLGRGFCPCGFELTLREMSRRSQRDSNVCVCRMCDCFEGRVASDSYLVHHRRSAFGNMDEGKTPKPHGQGPQRPLRAIDTYPLSCQCHRYWRQRRPCLARRCSRMELAVRPVRWLPSWLRRQPSHRPCPYGSTIGGGIRGRPRNFQARHQSLRGVHSAAPLGGG